MIFALVALAGCSFNQDMPVKAPAIDSTNRTEVKLLEHIDGDTTKFNVDGKEETVRYLLYDTPETRHPDLGKQPLGPEASDYVKKLLTEADKIELEFDVEKRDKYDRMLAYVYVDGKSVQEEVLKKGLARVGYIYESRRHLDDFRKAEDIAQEKKIGVWECPGYVTDDGFNPDKWCKDGNKPDEGNKGKFIASKDSKVYHEVGCPGAKMIKPENAVYFKSEQVAKDSGRRMCHSDGCPLN
ncbi:thermonuclease family protein [Marinithermofilum abyssi]|uniref:thermonuclease family protein n=1 Tax=Marinithermofilum abyssi TaxID=1571185 RepID=UPI001664D2B4|nr:thermonuclease family protein [Marinithermofilum abyssi]